MGVVVLALLAVACRTTGGTERTRETDRVELRVGERYVDPSRGLEVLPLSVGVNSARLRVRVDGLTRTIDLVVGPLGTETVVPYTFELVSTSLRPSATILITRR